MASLKDIANQSGFSIRTVSRVLKNTGYVKEDTRDLVLKTARDLGYRPNRFARSLRTGRSNSITVLMSSVDELYIEKVAGFEEYLRARGYSVDLLFTVPKPGLSAEEALELLRGEVMERSAAGVALFARSDIPLQLLVKNLEDNGLPCISFDVKEEPVDAVNIDRQQGVYEAVRYLLASGRKRVAYLGNTNDRSRLDGYHRALSESGMTPVYINLDEAPGAYLPFDQAILAAEEYCRMKDKPDAVQAYSDEFALGFLYGLHKIGVKVPQELALIGFDNRRATQLCWPRLTTVAQPNREVGQVAAEMLLSKISGENPPEGGWKRALPTKLIIRETT